MMWHCHLPTHRDVSSRYQESTVFLFLICTHTGRLAVFDVTPNAAEMKERTSAYSLL
jgi:hypothetical protein